MKRLVLIVAVLSLLALPLINGAAQTTQPKYKVGFCAMTLSFTWMTYAYKALVNEAAKYPDIQLIVQNANGDVSKQVNICEDFISQGVNAIITDPIDVNTLTPVIKEAVSKGIAFVTFDRNAVGAPYTFFVGSDDELAGRLALEYVAAKLDGVGKIVSITGQVGSSPAILRAQGIHDEIKNYPELKIVYEESGAFTTAGGLKAMEDAITATGGDFNAVICANDDSAVGAIQAMKEAGIDLSKVIVTGNDGVPDGLQAIQAGDLNMSVQYPVRMATVVMDEVAQYLEKGTMPAVKDLLLRPTCLMKSNLAQEADLWSALTTSK